MKLYIDTTIRDKVTIAFDKKRFELTSNDSKSQKLLEFIDETLKSIGAIIDDVTQIEVHTGPGSYTGIRIGVAVAQTLAWTLGLNLNGKNISKGETIEIVYD